MRSTFDEQLQKLNRELLEMGGLIEQSIGSATRALTELDADAAGDAIAFDRAVDHKERDIEALCLKLLLQQQPVARDLRQISAALKMITDMERIGDQAADIAGLVIYLVDEPAMSEMEMLSRMAEAAARMVTGSLDAYVHRDIELARLVIAMDDEVDGLFRDVRKALIADIRADACLGECAIDLVMIAKYFERIGDHAQNIAEWVEYAITGRHKGTYPV